MDGGDLASHRFLADELAEAQARRRRAVRGRASRTRGGSVPTGCGSSTRSTAPTSSASRAARLGGARRAVGRGPLRGRRGQPSRRSTSRSAPIPRRSYRHPAAHGRGSSRRATATRTPPSSSPTRSTPTPCGSARRAPRRWPSSPARPTSTCTTAACTSGTPPRRPRWRSPPACTSAGSTAHRWCSTTATRGCRTC